MSPPGLCESKVGIAPIVLDSVNAGDGTALSAASKPAESGNTGDAGAPTPPYNSLTFPVYPGGLTLVGLLYPPSETVFPTGEVGYPELPAIVDFGFLAVDPHPLYPVLSVSFIS